MRKRDNTVIWAIIACLLWSTAYSTIKIGLQYDSPLHFAGLRFLISGLLILPFTVRFSVYFALLKEHWKLVFWVTLLQTIMNYILFYLGLDLVPGALGAVIVGSQPLVTAIVASIMDKSEKLTRRKIVTIICGISGVILISAGRQAFKLGSAIELLGVFMIFAANIAVATSNVLISLRSKGINPLLLSSSTLLIGGFIIYLLSLAFEDIPECTKPAEYWIVLVWLGFMAAAAFSIWFRLLQRPHVKVSDLNLWKFIIPVVGAILSWLLVPGENPERLTVIGMIIISRSLIMFHKTGTRVHTD